MGNEFDWVGTVRRPPAPAAPTAPTASNVPGSNEFDWVGRGQPQVRAAAPAGNKAFGELRPAPFPGVTEYLRQKGQDALMALGMKPYDARHMSSGLVGAASITPMGTLFSAGDLASHSGPNLISDPSLRTAGTAALDTLGAIPGGRFVQQMFHGAPTVIPAHVPPPWVQRGSSLDRDFVTPSTGELVRTRPTVEPLTPAMERRAPPGMSSSAIHYETTRNAPIMYHPGTADDFAERAAAHIGQPNIGNTGSGGFTPYNAPGAYNELAYWRQQMAAQHARTGGPITPGDFDTLRQRMRNLEGTDAAAGRHVVDLLDRYMYQPPRGAVVAGGAQDLRNLEDAFAQARGDYRAGKTAEIVERGIDKSGTRARTTHSGMNVDNTTRQQMQALASPNPKTGQVPLEYATPDELATVMGASDPGWLGGQLRGWGKYLGGGGGLGQLQATGWAVGAGAGLGQVAGLDPVTSALIAGGSAATAMGAGNALVRAGNRRAVSAAEDAADYIRRNSPEYARRLEMSPSVIDAPTAARDAITYAMMGAAREPAEGWWNEQFTP